MPFADLSAFALFKNVPDALIREVLPAPTVITLKPGDRLLTQGHFLRDRFGAPHTELLRSR